MTTLLTVIKMVADRLVDDGYDGLFSEDGECACAMPDLAPCGAIQESCTAGYRNIPTPGEEFDFLIVAKKPVVTP